MKVCLALTEEIFRNLEILVKRDLLAIYLVCCYRPQVMFTQVSVCPQRRGRAWREGRRAWQGEGMRGREAWHARIPWVDSTRYGQ